MPPPIQKKENNKHEWELNQIKQFTEAAKNYRDKAIILTIFQSGLAVNEICELNYGDIQVEFEQGMLPVCLRLVRQKTQIEFKTFLGHDAIKYLGLYLATRKDLKPESPLFTKERTRGGEERITPAAIQQSFSEIAKDLGFIRQNGGFNPARPHSLRAAFNSRLIGKIDETLREFWMGHTIGGVARAYLNMPTEELRKLYLVAEEFLKIEKSSNQVLEEKVRGSGGVSLELEEKVKVLAGEVEGLRDELAVSRGEVRVLAGVVDAARPFFECVDEFGEFFERWREEKLCKEKVEREKALQREEKEVLEGKND